MNFNKVILAGHLTRDPEMRHTKNGDPIVNFGLAINRSWKGEDGAKKEEVTFVDITAFGVQGETISKYVQKGRPLLVEGRLKLDQWEDKETGKPQSKLKVVLERFSFLDSKQEEEQETAPEPKPAAHQLTVKQSKPRYKETPFPKTESAPVAAPTQGGYGPDDDVPF